MSYKHSDLTKKIINPNIHIMGELENKDKRKAFEEIDVLIVPSLWYENSPLVIAEAFLSKIPVITSNIGGMAELVKDGENGFTFPVGDAEKLMKEIEGHKIRVDLDDRSITLGKKVREAEREWVNYVLVIGERELSSDVLPVRDRKAGKKMRKMKLQELITEISEKTGDKPFKPLALPKLLSKRPQFAF